MKKNFIIIAVIICILVIAGALREYVAYLSAGIPTFGETLTEFSENDLSGSEKITCTYHNILGVNYLGGNISHNLPKPENNPFIFTFSKLDDGKKGQLSFIDSTQTITTVPLITLNESSDKVVYLEGNDNYLTTHTIYKKSGVSVYTKSVDLIGIPSGSLAMGSCVGY